MTADDAHGASAEESEPTTDPAAPVVDPAPSATSGAVSASDEVAPTDAEVDLGASAGIADAEPAEAGPGEAPVPDADTDADLATRSRVVLADMAVVAHGAGFWDDLDRAFADEAQLRLTPRAAIRPITQPPPILDDRHVREEPVGPSLQLPPRRPERRRWLWVVVAVVVGLIVAGLLQAQDDPPIEIGDAPADSASAADPGDDEPRTPETTVPSATRVAPDDELEPSGIGPLQVGVPLSELQDNGVGITPDQATFDTSGGTCFDATVHGSPDLALRFRAPDPGVPMEEPGGGRLVAVDLKGPTNRPMVDTGVTLDAPQEQVLLAYAGNILDAPHPWVAAGHLYIVPVGNGTGVAFGTDGRVVTSISAGLTDVIGHMAGCG